MGYLALITGIILYLYYSFSDDFESLNALQKITLRSTAAASISWGVVFLGFAEIVSLLQGIYNVQRKIAGLKDDNVDHLPNVAYTFTQDGSKLSPLAKRELIFNYYSNKGVKVNFDKIEISPEENICFVEVNREKIAVDISGSEPVEVPMDELKKI